LSLPKISNHSFFRVLFTVLHVQHKNLFFKGQDIIGVGEESFLLIK